jgi:ketosteroid isomerase-like protein
VAGEHLETIREGYASFNRGDTSWAWERVTDDVAWGTTGAFPGLEKVYRGPEGVEEWVRAVREEFEAFQVAMDEVIVERGSTVAIVERIWERGRGSGAEGQMRVYTVYRFNPEGKILERHSFTSRDEALAAL